MKLRSILYVLPPEGCARAVNVLNSAELVSLRCHRPVADYCRSSASVYYVVGISVLGYHGRV